MGLEMCASMPASSVRAISSANALAVAAMMGICRASRRSSDRMRRAASQPSISGICMSMRMASKVKGRDVLNISTASRPFHAGTTLMPFRVRISEAISILITLSSARRIRMPSRFPSEGMGFCSSTAGAAAPLTTSNGRETVKTLPFPSVLFTVIRPLICVTMLRTMDMPRPVPMTFLAPKRVSRE